MEMTRASESLAIMLKVAEPGRVSLRRTIAVAALDDQRYQPERWPQWRYPTEKILTRYSML